MEQRAFQIGQNFKRAAAGELVVDMAFASELPYERWWGTEVLQMKGARLDRLNSGDGGPVLYNHDWNDLRGRHMPGSVRADKDGVLRGQIVIPQATQATRDAAALIESKTLTKASVGYQIHTIVEKSTSKSGEKIERTLDGATFERLLEAHTHTRDGRTVGGDLAAFQRGIDAAAGPIERAEDAPPVYLVTDWEPLENSLVTIPADNTVGVGRSLEVSHPAAPAATTERKATMADNQAAAGANAESLQGQSNALPVQPRQGPTALDLEQQRVRAIENLCRANSVDNNVREHWVGTGLSIEAITEDLLKILEERGKRNPKSDASLGLSNGDVRRFSMFNAIRAVTEKNWTNAGFELECSRAIANKLQRLPDPNKFYVPFEVQQAPQRRDLTVASASGGGYMVGTDNQSFIEMMRNSSVVYRMGARRLAGLVGNVTIPKQTAAGTAVWLANEASTITESAQTFGQLALSPKSVGGYTEISRNLLLQSSPDAESIVRSDLATVCALAIDVGALRGSGASGEPQGIVGTSGVGSVTGTSLAAAGVLEFQSDVGAGNLLSGNFGYVTTPAVAALLMARPELPSTGTTRLWLGSMLEGSMFGMRAMSSNQMSSATMLAGDFSQVVIGEWGVMEVEVNPYANFQAGIVGVRAIVSVDVGVRYGGAFSYSSSIT